VPTRRLSALVVAALLLAGVLITLYLLGERSCPPPDWAFWRFTDGGGGRTNFACVASG